MGCAGGKNKSEKKKDGQQDQKAEMVIQQQGVDEAELREKLTKAFREGTDERTQLPTVQDKIQFSSKNLNEILSKAFTVHLSVSSLSQIKHKLHEQAQEAQENIKAHHESDQYGLTSKDEQIKIRNIKGQSNQENKSREQKIRDGMVLLEQRLSNNQISQKEMKDDGNCQFRAISQGIFGTQEYHSLLRAIAVWQLQQDRDSYIFWFEEGQEGMNKFCDGMSQLSTWGTQLTLKALVDSLGITLHILQSTKENYYLIYKPDEIDGPYLQHHVFLTYIEPIHYNCIVQKAKS